MAFPKAFPIEPIPMPGGPVLVFGGPYSNLEATQAMLAEAARRGIPPERVICTGDVVAYGADARATVDLVRRSGIRVVMGNCEESLAAGAADCGCGYAEGSACDRLSAAWYAHAAATLDGEARAWMAGLPRRLDILVGGARLAVVHGGLDEINRFVFASARPEAKRAAILAAGCDGVIGGHCGIPFSQVIDGRLWHNAGAIGMPANDGTPRVWYSVLDAAGDGLRVEHAALEYDWWAAAAKMRACSLPEEYAAALGSGVWPSCDVLPAAEIRQQGLPLEPGGLIWTKRTAAVRRGRPATVEAAWPDLGRSVVRPLDAKKFQDPDRTAAGETRAAVRLGALRTLWFNTGTLCNITCRNCYIESSPRNDRLVYLAAAEVREYLDEIRRDGLPTEEIGFTGGEPFMNPEILPMLELCLERGFRVLVLTNAMKPMQRLATPLLDLQRRLGTRLSVRVSLDHFTKARHEEERGEDTWESALAGLRWLAAGGFDVAVAGRTLWGEPDAVARAGYRRLFAAEGIAVDAGDPGKLVLFPEMDKRADVPEITEHCWDILKISPASMMCASSRMVVHRKGATHASVLSCTLLPYDEAFDLGPTLATASCDVKLNHPHCAKFCVLGGASCSAAA